MCKEIRPLTQEQQDFATERHNLIFSFLNERGLPEDEFYDVVVFGFLRAVRRYSEDAELRTQYKFKTIAFGAMRSMLSNYYRAARVQMRSATVIQLDEDVHGVDVDADVSGKVVSLDAIRKLMGGITPKQAQIVGLKVEGHTHAQIGRVCGMTPRRVSREINAVRDSIPHFAPDLVERVAA